jgi:CBS domain-containing protein
MFLEPETRMTSEILVGDIMTKDVKVAQVDTSVKEVIAAMNKFHIGSVVIVQGERPVGIITERDILKRIVELDLAPEYTTAGKAMTTPVLTISETASIDEAAILMAKRKIKKLPVVDNEELVGIVTTTDIVTKALGLEVMQ